MINSVIGTKISQSQYFTVEGKRIPVTNILVGPLFIVDFKTEQKDGYNAVKLGLGRKRIGAISKPELGNLKKAGLLETPPRFLREIEVDKQVIEEDQLKIGMSINAVDVFKEGDRTQVIGISKGKGFQGGVKRHHFKGGPKTHGQSDRERGPGSIGQTTTPGRVYKGKRMAGRMGGDRITVKNLKVLKIDTEKNILMLSGLVPGGRNSLLIIEKI